MNKREHAVLSLFYNEGNRELTPSFLAYRMRMSTRDATALLDKMVKHGTLDLDVDDNGNLLYRLPESERRLLSEQRKSQGTPKAGPAAHRPQSAGAQPQTGHGQSRPYVRKTPNGPQNGAPRQQGAPRGTDATAGYADNAPSGATRQAISQRQSAHDGTDGSLYPVTSSTQTHSRSSSTTRTSAQTTTQTTPQSPSGVSTGGPQSDLDYDDWYQSDAAPSTHPGHNAHNPGAAIPERQALAPYQTADHHPAPRFGPYPDRERIPVLAGALSLLVPGLGQFYNGEVGKGVMLLFSCLLLSVFLLFWIVWIWSVIDAYMIAEQSNQKALADDSPSPHPHLLPDQRPPTSTTNSNAA